MKKVLFLDDCNMFEGANPRAYLVEVSTMITVEIMKSLERCQVGVGRRGGKWKEIFEDGKIEYKLISQGRQSDYNESDYDETYKVISGNY